MKLISFQVSTKLGQQIRIGAVTDRDLVVDLQAGYRLFLVDSGMPERAAARISRALLPADMVDFIEAGDQSMEAAHKALDWASKQGKAHTKN